MATKTLKTLHKDETCRIFEAQGMIHVQYHGDGRIYTPSILEHRDFSARDFASLRGELIDSGISEGLAFRWVEQAQGFFN